MLAGDQEDDKTGGPGVKKAFDVCFKNPWKDCVRASHCLVLVLVQYARDSLCDSVNGALIALKTDRPFIHPDWTSLLESRTQSGMYWVNCAGIPLAL